MYFFPIFVGKILLEMAKKIGLGMSKWRPANRYFLAYKAYYFRNKKKSLSLLQKNIKICPKFSNFSFTCLTMQLISTILSFPPIFLLQIVIVTCNNLFVVLTFVSRLKGKQINVKNENFSECKFTTCAIRCWTINPGILSTSKACKCKNFIIVINTNIATHLSIKVGKLVICRTWTSCNNCKKNQ